MAWFSIAAGVLLAVSWSLLVTFFATRSEAADRASNIAGVPALVGIGVAMGAVLDRFASRSAVVVSILTGVGLLAVGVALVSTAALVFRLVEFPRVAIVTTVAWVLLFLWMGAASALILVYGGLPRGLGWLGIATVGYALAILAFVMRDPEVRSGRGEPARSEMIAGAPVLVLLPLWFVLLGVAL